MPIPASAVRDALRLSRGMSYKNAMAGLPLGGGKAVILADAQRTKTPEMLAAYGRAVERLGGQLCHRRGCRHDVADLVAISKQTRHVAGLPVAEGEVGGDPGPHTSYGVFLGVQAAVKRALGKDSLAGLHLAIQGAGSVAGGLARRAAAGRRPDQHRRHRRRPRRRRWPTRSAARSSRPRRSCRSKPTCSAPTRSARSSTRETIAALNASVVAGGANNQLATPGDGDRVQQRGILYAPDYVINAGGIINVSTEYLRDGDQAVVAAADRGDPGAARADLGRKRRHRPQPRRGRRRHGAEADRAGLTDRNRQSIQG